MNEPLSDLTVIDAEEVRAPDIPRALTAASILYEDGATQAFAEDGKTVYVENGRRTLGEWYVDAEGQFCSFWPPDYRACYELRWLVEDGRIAGLRFRRGYYSAIGRYQLPGPDNAVKE